MDDQSKIERKKAKVREENKSGKSHVMHRATLIQSGPEKGANKWTSVIGDDTCVDTMESSGEEETGMEGKWDEKVPLIGYYMNGLHGVGSQRFGITTAWQYHWVVDGWE
ncbi:hypothetical protein PRIPAC_95129 [Pristionchus pacificus]|uniref:Uncharacterized protein n=1 Tax=Pristionchus pacificus TaxID=54126 RepID=A0A2A6CJ70_PRIPA|nr:hypothetical protein PRIPAC_95129 [Pristionchus pacificus]|eukprot:PDM78150.1 hypothetical protein PRIPAC_33940 [Pristionchus pacificus]